MRPFSLFARLSLSVSANNFSTKKHIFMKFGTEIMPLEATSMPNLLILYLQLFENGGR
jgi:hypothetical protein